MGHSSKARKPKGRRKPKRRRAQQTHKMLLDRLKDIVDNELRLTRCTGHCYGFYIPDLIVKVGPYKDDAVVMDVVNSVQGLIHAIGGFYMIKALGCDRLFKAYVAVLADDLFEYLSGITAKSPETGGKKHIILKLLEEGLEKDRIYLRPFNAIKGWLDLQLQECLRTSKVRQGV